MLTQEQQQAKQLALALWQYLYRHPLKTKDTLPKKLQDIIDKQLNQCPLCEVFFKRRNYCIGCPLDRCTYSDHPYFKWSNTMNPFLCWKYAKHIYNMIKAWE